MNNSYLHDQNNLYYLKRNLYWSSCSSAIPGTCIFFYYHIIKYYRILLCDREESRPSESFFRTVLKPVFYFFPTAISTPTEVVARAMVNNAISPPSENKTELFENKAIHMLAGNLKPKPEEMVKPVKKSAKEFDDNQEL